MRLVHVHMAVVSSSISTTHGSEEAVARLCIHSLFAACGKLTGTFVGNFCLILATSATRFSASSWECAVNQTLTAYAQQ